MEFPQQELKKWKETTQLMFQINGAKNVVNI